MTGIKSTRALHSTMQPKDNECVCFAMGKMSTKDWGTRSTEVTGQCLKEKEAQEPELILKQTSVSFMNRQPIGGDYVL